MLKFKSLKNEKGFTYVEVVMGVFLLIFLIALFVIFTDGVNMVRMAKERNQGMSVAQQKMEELQDTEFDQVNSDYIGEHRQRGGIDYTVITLVHQNFDLDGDGNYSIEPNMKNVVVYVWWDSPDQYVDLVAYFYNE